MSTTAGKKIKLMCSGSAVAMVGEAVTATGNLVYQVTSTLKRVFDRTSTISVHKRSSVGNSAVSGTTTTNIKIVGHGLVTGNLIVNTTRSSASRIITRVDNDNFTVATVTSQTTGDSIDFYPTEAPTSYSLDRLTGTVTYGSAISRTILISGNYLPMTEMVDAKEVSYSLTASNEDVTTFGNNWTLRKQTLKDITASISNFYMDNTYIQKLLTGEPIVLEIYINRDNTYFIKAWVVCDSNELSGDPTSIVDESLEFSGTADADGRVVSLGTGL